MLVQSTNEKECIARTLKNRILDIYLVTYFRYYELKKSFIPSHFKDYVS